jgi:DNA (cytosine-5)-methyltransferase 1
MNELALFAGAGGGILGGHLLGWRTVCAVEWEPYAASVLAARQNDGLLTPFPIWDDVQTFDGRPWRGIVDVVSGGFPCQDISVAGKGAGIDGARSGMWTHMARIVGEVRPRYIFVENSPALLTRGLGRVLGDLASLGYDCRWTVLGAADVGAPHQRDRFWLVGHTISNRWTARRDDHAEHDRRELGANDQHADPLAYADHSKQRADSWHWQGGRQIETRDDIVRGGVDVADTNGCGLSWQQWPTGSRQAGATGRRGEEVSNTDQKRLQVGNWGSGSSRPFSSIEQRDWWDVEPNVGRVAHGVAARVDRLKAIGNGQVPLCAATAWRILNAA